MSYTRSICLLSALLCYCNVSAAEPLPPITITASRTAIPIEEVPGALTVITKQEIENQHALYVSELLQNVPGLNISTQGSAGSVTQVRIRGAEANQVLVIIDGVEANDPANSSEFNFAHLPVDNIERIEVLRGPQSSLWGSDALAGVINITTTRPGTGKKFIATSAYGTNDSYQGGLKILLGSEDFDFALSGNFIDTDGFNSATSGHERDGYDNTTVNLKTDYRITDSINIGATTRYTNASNEFDPAPLGLPEDGFGKNDIEQFYARGFIKIQTFDNNWVHLADVSIIDTSNDSIDGTFGRSQSEATKEKFSFQSTFQSLEFEPLSLKQSFTFALEREQERFKQQGASSSSSDPNQRQKITNDSKVSEYRANFLNQWTLSASLRYDDNDQFNNQNTYRVGISYLHPTSNTKTYVAHATGAKNPTFTELFGFSPTSFIGNLNLETETSESWEIGISQDLFNNRLHFEAALFWEDLIDEIQTVFLPSFESTVVNSESRSKRNGLELSMHSQLTDTLSASGSYTYLDASESDTSGNTRTEVRRPDHQWSGQVNHSFMDNKANLNININHIGDRRDINFSNSNRLTLDDYTLVNVAMNYQFNDTLKVFARTNNLLDEEYQDVFGFETSEFSALIGIELKL